MKLFKNITLSGLIILCLFSCQDGKVSDVSISEKKSVEVSDSIHNTFLDHSLSFPVRVQKLIDTLTLEEKISQLAYDSPAIPRLGISAYNWWNEALHGVARFGRATIFPQPIGMAATFDEDLIFRISDAISTEGRAKHQIAMSMKNYTQYGGLTYWSPNVNIFRDPRWGRGMETWGEDPLLTGILGAAFVRGLQGADTKYLKSAACAKHFAVHSGPEADRHHFNAKPSDKDLYETYLPAFEMLVKEAKVEAVMCAYTRLNDSPCCGSDFLLTETLVNDWGFEGHIVSDCWAINDFHLSHKVTNSQVESAAMALNAGVQLNCGDAYDSLTVAYDKGLVSEELINQSLRKLLLTRFKLGLFDPAEILPFQYDESVINSAEHIAISREAAQKSVVLLKNDDVLPLDKNLKNLFVIGPMAANVDAMVGNYNGVSGNVVTIYEGISGAVSAGTRMEYRKGFFMDRDNINKMGWAIDAAKETDLTIAVMGINSELEGEEGESIASPTRSDRINLKLPENQLDYLKKLREGYEGKLVVIMTGGSPIEIQEIYDIADAVLWAWYPGEQGGNGVADVLFGEVSPSGKLPITFPKSVDQLPAYDDYTMKGRTYKYMEKEPLFPFGFGLSYADLTYGLELNASVLSSSSDSVKCSIAVSNLSELEVEEVIQLYIKPKGQENLPIYVLKTFDRIKTTAGSITNLDLYLSQSDFQFINEKGESVLVKGEYDIIVAGSLPSRRSIDLGAPIPAIQSIIIN